MNALKERIELVKREIAERQDLLDELERKQRGEYKIELIEVSL